MFTSRAQPWELRHEELAKFPAMPLEKSRPKSSSHFTTADSTKQRRDSADNPREELGQCH
jgi:hypothetical protein